MIPRFALGDISARRRSSGSICRLVTTSMLPNTRCAARSNGRSSRTPRDGSHGHFHVPGYIASVRSGKLNATTELKVGAARARRGQGRRFQRLRSARPRGGARAARRLGARRESRPSRSPTPTTSRPCGRRPKPSPSAASSASRSSSRWRTWRPPEARSRSTAPTRCRSRGRADEGPSAALLRPGFERERARRDHDPPARRRAAP